MATQLNFEGRFSLWVYDVSHGVMLLRKNPGAGGIPRRVEIRFNDVRAINICGSFESINIEEVSTDDCEWPLCRVPETLQPGLKIYRITTQNWNGYVIAGSVQSRVDDGSFGDPSGIYKPGPLMKCLASNGYYLD